MNYPLPYRNWLLLQDILVDQLYRQTRDEHPSNLAPRPRVYNGIENKNSVIL